MNIISFHLSLSVIPISAFAVPWCTVTVPAAGAEWVRGYPQPVAFQTSTDEILPLNLTLVKSGVSRGVIVANVANAAPA